MLFLLLCSTRFDNISRNQRVGMTSEQSASYRYVRKRKKHLYLRRNANKTMVVESRVNARDIGNQFPIEIRIKGELLRTSNNVYYRWQSVRITRRRDISAASIFFRLSSPTKCISAPFERVQLDDFHHLFDKIYILRCFFLNHLAVIPVTYV